jgi:hypothetical protein
VETDSPGYSIAQLRGRFGSDVGHLTDPSGRLHRLDLGQWARKDPHKTRLRVRWRSEKFPRSQAPVQPPK